MSTQGQRDAKMNRFFRTPRGTELPILSLRGRDYLEVKYRLVWFREEHPDWSIITEIISLNENSAYARATVKDEQGRVIATSHKFESKQGFPDFIEKAETGAIGRALALIGYGTQFCADELDEGDRIVDSPVDVIRRGDVEEAGTTQEPILEAKAPHEQIDRVNQGQLDPGDYRISFGKKYKGKRLKEIPRQEIEGYMDWLEATAARRGVPLSDEARYLKLAVGRYLSDEANH